MVPRRHLLVGLFGGVLHAGVLLFVALDLGYSVGPSAYSVGGMIWRYGGLIGVVALPLWLALRYRVVLPLFSVILTVGYVLGMELTPPGPTFRDVAELERLSEPTGIMVVENGLYIIRYMIHATVWTFGFMLLGLIEIFVRNTRQWLPATADVPLWATGEATRTEGLTIALLGGLAHAIVMGWFAFRLGVTLSGGPDWILYLQGGVGMVLLAGLPLFLLVRHRYLSPASLLVAFILLDVRAEFTATVDSPHGLYFGAWFFYLAIILIVTGVEYLLRKFGLPNRLLPIDHS